MSIRSSHELLVDALRGSDDELGMTLVAIAIRNVAHSLGLEDEDINEEFGKKVIENLLNAEAETASLAAVEKAFHKAAMGDVETAGKLIREYLYTGAEQIKLREFAVIGVRKSRQAKDFVEGGATESRQKGRNNERLVIDAAKKIVQSRTSSRKPTVRELAPDIAIATGLAERTIRRHLSAKRLDLIWSLRS